MRSAASWRKLKSLERKVHNVKKQITLLLSLALCFSQAPVVMAQETESSSTAEAEGNFDAEEDLENLDTAEAANAPVKEETIEAVQSQHAITVGGETLNYTAAVGKMPVTVGENQCEIFFTAYTLDGVEDVGDRPITFAFNGGPGSSSEWLHLGALGPRRVQVDETGNPTGLPVKIIDNEYTILGLTDLVFIDPVGTGYSTAAEGTDPDFFYTYDGDIASVSEFIRLYVTQNGRWSSPKYLSGESYGTIRAVGLADHLSSAYSMGVNGIMLISSINDFSTVSDFGGGDPAYSMMLPTFAAIARYHNMLAEPYQSMELEAYLDEVKDFAAGDYQLALYKGARLTEEELDAAAEKLAGYTGLKKEFVLSANLRVDLLAFCTELLADRKLDVGRFDGRYTGPASSNADMYSDPSDTALDNAFGIAINQYLGDELGYHTDETYVTLSYNVLSCWSYDLDNSILDQKDTIVKLLNNNRFLKIWVLCGYYDLATPFGAAEWVYDHVFVQDEARKNLNFTYYESGHMFYLHQPSLARFRQEAEAWYQDN